jgi:ABC-2 type transport system permease protein
MSTDLTETATAQTESPHPAADPTRAARAARHLSPSRIDGPRPTSPVSFGRLVWVEWRKQLDTRAGRWLLMTIGLVTAAVLAIMLAVDGGQRSFPEFAMGTVLPMSLLLPIVGILAVTSEWSQRSALVTFTLEPRRTLVGFAKLVSALLSGAVAFAVAIGLAALMHLASITLRGNEPSWDISKAVLAGALLLTLLGVAQGVAFGMVLLNTPAAIVSYLVLPTVWSILGSMVSWLKDAAQWLDLGTASTPLMEAGRMTGEQWVHLGTATLVWVVLPLAVGLVRVTRSEVK